eukprot:14887643-Heterocapsa_arctica.AAC.1
MPDLVVEIERGLKTHKRFIMPFVPGIPNWEWDGFDEIWGFDDVPRLIDDYEELVQAHLDGHVRGIPTGIEPADL